MKVNRWLLASLDPPMMPSYCLCSVATTSLHNSCNNIAWCTVWLEKTCLHHCFQRLVHIVIGLTKSSATLALRGLSEHCRGCKTISLVPLSPTTSPPDVHSCQLGFAMITNIHSPTWMCLAPCIITIVGQPPSIFNEVSPTKHVGLILLHRGTLHN